MAILVTGGAGFIGSNLIHHLRRAMPEETVVCYDALTYSGNMESLANLQDDPGFHFIKGDIRDRAAVKAALQQHDVTRVMHLAAESHVDRSILDPLVFVKTNIEGTAVLLQETHSVWEGRDDVLFQHVSTDEVFGSLGPEGFFSEETPYQPRSPYSASKAASDHLVRAWHETYDFPVVITNCSNNYGPYQFPEKLIPVVMMRAMAQEPVPVYGKGENVRDWLFVTDHCEALTLVLQKGRVGETYCIGGDSEYQNLELVRLLLDEVDRQLERPPGSSRELITFVKDRPGHDLRYAIDASKLKRELGWSPRTPLAEGLQRTVAWYLANNEWTERVKSGAYREFAEAWYRDR